MKKRFLGILGVAALGALSLASCAKDEDVFHIYAWNQEFQGFFNKYVSDEKTDKAKVYHLDGKKVKWTINPSDNGVYQTKLDAALKKNATEKSKSKRVDMFLAEADYIGKYINSDASLDVKSLGVTNLLPIPALDGGKLLLIIIEAIRGKKLSDRVEMNIQLIGFTLLIALSIFVTYNDISRII